MGGAALGKAATWAGGRTFGVIVAGTGAGELGVQLDNHFAATPNQVAGGAGAGWLTKGLAYWYFPPGYPSWLANAGEISLGWPLGEWINCFAS